MSVSLIWGLASTGTGHTVTWSFALLEKESPILSAESLRAWIYQYIPMPLLPGSAPPILKAGFTGPCSPVGSCDQKELIALGLMLCSHHPDILNKFLIMALHFRFSLSPAILQLVFSTLYLLSLHLCNLICETGITTPSGRMTEGLNETVYVKPPPEQLLPSL